MNTLLGAYLTGAFVGLLAGVLLVLAAWAHTFGQPQQEPVLDELPTDLLPRIHHLDDARRAPGAHRKEHTR